MNYAKAIDEIWTVINIQELDDWFSQDFDEQLEKCDVFMEKGDVNEIPLKTLREYVDDYNSYLILRELIESIKKYKEDFEKQVRAKEAYKKVNKKQSDKIQELKKEIAEQEQLKEEKKEFYEQLANKAKEASSIIKNQKHQIHQLEATIETIKCLKEQVDASLKEENEKLKEENKKLNKIIRETKRDRGYSVTDSEEESEEYTIEINVVGLGWCRYIDEEDRDKHVVYCKNGCWKLKGDKTAKDDEGNYCETDEEE